MKEPKEENLQWDKLLPALYHCWDGCDRSAVTMFLRGKTAEQALKNERLESPKVYLGFRKNEYDSGQGRIFKAFIEHGNYQLTRYEQNGDDILTYSYQGVPVEIKLYPDNPTLIYPNPIIYEHETFLIPNPYKEFKEKYE